MDKLADNLGYILNLIAAAAALGTAAFGLVDASKAFWGGLSNPGFGYIRKAIAALLAASTPVAAAFGPNQILQTLRANWLNGVSKADQKAVAKSLIRLMLKPETAPAMAAAVGVNADHLTLAARHVQDDENLTEQDIKVLGTALGVGILIDATLVRALLVPALVSLFGRWNWWLPAGLAKVLRVEPSPVARAGLEAGLPEPDPEPVPA